jgi:ElaB/YqjD/DUF883 family membrane-anchored ribosome-binding protein
MKANCEETGRQREAEAIAATECTQLGAELANLRAELDQRRRADFEAIMQAVTRYSKDILDHVNDVLDQVNDVLDQVKALAPRVCAELFDRVDRRLAALQARVEGVLPDRKTALRSARERDDEITDASNPLPPRPPIN